MMIDKTWTFWGVWYHYLVCFAIYYRFFFSEKLWTSGFFRPFLIEVIQKYVCLKLLIFDPHPLFIHVHFICTPHQRTLCRLRALVSYPLSKKFHNSYEFSNEKLGSEGNREKDFFLQTQPERSMFFKQLYNDNKNI